MVLREKASPGQRGRRVGLAVSTYSVELHDVAFTQGLQVRHFHVICNTVVTRQKSLHLTAAGRLQNHL